MPDYRYYLGPLESRIDYPESDPYWAAPGGTVAMVDLASLPEQGNLNGDYRPVAFLAADQDLGTNWTLLGRGDCRDIAVTGAMQDAWLSVSGYRPNGARMVDLLWDHLTTGSDVAGQQSCMPLVPTVQGDLELWLPGHSRVRAERFVFGTHPHTAKIKRLLQNQLIDARRDAHAGQAQDPEFHRRVAQAMCEKYRVDFEQLRPAGWPKAEVPLPHGSDYTDNFNRANGALGANWTSYAPTAPTIVSNLVEGGAGGLGDTIGRYETSLASADTYSQVDVVQLGRLNHRVPGCIVRKDTTSTLTYYMWRIKLGGTAFVQYFKAVANTLTQLGSDVAFVRSLPDTLKLTANGSTLTGYLNGAAQSPLTDTSISAGLRTGFYFASSNDGAPFGRLDNWAGGDLAQTQYTMSAGTGAFALSGQTSTSLVTHVVDANVGEFLAAGLDVAMSRNCPLLAAAGAFDVSGILCDMSRTRHLAVDTGTFSVTGTDVGFTWIHRFAADKGTFGLTGVDATVGRHRGMVADVANFNIIPVWAGLSRIHLCVADVGAFDLTGGDATLRVPRAFTVNSGTFAIDAQTIAIGRACHVLPDTAAYTLAGVAPRLARPWPSLVAGAGAFIFTGVSVTMGRARASGAGTFALTGPSSTLMARRMLPADLALFVLAGPAHEIPLMEPMEFTFTGRDVRCLFSGMMVGARWHHQQSAMRANT